MVFASVSLDLLRIILLIGHARWFAMIGDDSMVRKQEFSWTSRTN